MNFKSSIIRAVHSGTVCCYARVKDEAFFGTHDFYRVDIELLRQLGYQVVVTNSIRRMLQTKCDIYYAWWFGYGVFAAILGRIRRKPVIVSGVIHNLSCGGLSAWPWIKRSVMKLTMKLADCSIVCSQGEYNRLDGFLPRRCEIVSLPIDTRVYALNSAERSKTVLMVTQLNAENVERKMVLPALAAFAHFRSTHPEFKLIVCGAIGDGIESVQDFARKCQIDAAVSFTGRVSLKEKVALMQDACIYLQPTSCEGFGLAIGEALACGTPVVTSPELCVVETYGDAVHYGATPAELAESMSALADNEALRRVMQERALSQIEKYSLENRRERYRTIFEQAGAYLY